MPEVTKQAVPEKKMPPVVPKKPEAPPDKGTCGGGLLDGGGNEWSPALKQCFVLCECDEWPVLIVHDVKILISLKCQKFQKKLSQKRKWLFPKSQKPLQPKVHVSNQTLQQGTLSWSPPSLSVKVFVSFLIFTPVKVFLGI